MQRTSLSLFVALALGGSPGLPARAAGQAISPDPQSGPDAPAPVAAPAPQAGSTDQLPPPAPTDADPAGTDAPAAQRPPSDVTQMEAVVVQGTRASLQKSQAIKRNAPNVVDAISAEEVGKFPDANVAEALQRVAGIAIGRDTGGEGNKLSLRGLGPDFTATLFNGRRLASEDGTRAFNFDVLPSEMISSAEVNKSALAVLPEGGSAGTINIKTARPLDNPGTHFSGSLSRVTDDLTDVSKPKVTAVFSTTNRDETMGFLLGLHHYARTQQDQFFRQNWRILEGYPGANTSLTSNLGQNMLAYGAQAMPHSTNYGVNNNKRRRDGLNFAFDWKLNDDMTLRVDGMRTLLSGTARTTSFNVEPYLWLSRPADEVLVDDMDVDENGTVTRIHSRDLGSPRGEGDPGLLNNYSFHGPRDAVTDGYGANLEWRISDATTATLDAWYSTAVNDVLGKTEDILLSHFLAPGTVGTWINPGPLEPAYFEGIGNLRNPNGDPDPQQIGAGYSLKYGGRAEEKIAEVRADFETAFAEGALARLQYGLYRADNSKTNVSASSPYDPEDISCAYCGVMNQLPNWLFSGTTRVPDFLGGDAPLGPSEFLEYDAEAYWDLISSEEYLATLPDQDQADEIRRLLALYPGGYDAVIESGSYSRVKETVDAAYLAATFEGDLGSVPWSAVLGLRYVRTKVNSSGNVRPIVGFAPAPNDPDIEQVVRGEPVLTTRESSYDEWLPTLNLRFDLTDSVVVRAAAYRTLTRPLLGDLRVNDSYGGNSESGFTLSGGNPDLKPFIADNADLSLEWYINDSSYLAASAFYKRVDGFALLQEEQVEILGRPFTETRPVNAQAAYVHGYEASAQYVFDFLPALFDGLGAQVNYTWMDTNRPYDPVLGADQFTITGLSDTGNAILFYDKGPLSLRAAYNWRDRYNENSSNGTFVEPFATLDLSGSYAFNKHISVFFQAINVLDEQSVRWQGYQNRLTYVSRAAGYYAVGLRGVW